MKTSIKKILSVAMTTVLLVGMLAVGGVFVSAKEQTNNTNIFANFTTAARYSAFTATGAATSFSFAKMTPTYGYDGVNNAATFKTTGGYDTDPTRSAEFWLFLNGLSGVKVKGNETIVLKVKRSNTAMAPYATTAYVNGTPVDVTPTFTDAGDGWQYLTLTAASSAIIAKVGQNGYDTGEWTNIRIPFNGTSYNSGDTFSVAWAGAFANLDAAIAQDTHQAAADVDTTVARPGTFIDLSTNANYDAFVTKANADRSDRIEYLIQGGTMGYDPAVGAAVFESTVSSADTTDFRVGLADGSGTSKMTENTVIAFKLKATNPSAVVGWNTAYTSACNWRGLNSNKQLSTSNSTDWRLYTLNVSTGNYSNADLVNAYNSDANWAGADLWFNGTNLNVGDKLYIAWMGVFENEAAAQAYYNQTTSSPLFFDFTTPENFNANVGKVNTENLTYNYAAPEFDSNEGALKMTVSNAANGYNRFDLYDNTKNDLLKDYSVMAFKVKFSSGTALTGGHQVVRSNKTNWSGATLLQGANGTTDWQLIMIDTSAAALWNNAVSNMTGSDYSADTWAGFGLWTRTTQRANGDTMHVAWAGAFTDAAAAQAAFAASNAAAENKQATVGSTATFTAGTADVDYQWQKSVDGTTWTNIDGATAATYTTPAAKLEDNGTQYRAIIDGRMATKTATLAVGLSELPSVVGAQLRDKDNSFRYVLKAKDADLAALEADYTVEYGTIIVNAAKFEGTELTVTDKTSGFGSKNPTTVACTSAFVPQGVAYEGYKVWTLALAGIDTAEKQATDVAVKAYIKVANSNGGEWIFYSNDDTTTYGAYATNYNAVQDALQKTAA